MFAKSERELNLGGVNNPLFAKQTPLPATVSATAGADLKQYQVCFYESNGKVTPATAVAPISGKQLCVAAFDAANGKSVSIYVNGTFNVDALNLTAITAIPATATATQKKEQLVKFNSPVVFFENLSTDSIQRA